MRRPGVLLVFVSASLVVSSPGCKAEAPSPAPSTAPAPPADLTIVELEVPDLAGFVSEHPWCARKSTGRKVRFERDGGFVLEDPRAPTPSGGAVAWVVSDGGARLVTLDGGARLLDIQAGTVDGKVFVALDGELFSACD